MNQTICLCRKYKSMYCIGGQIPNPARWHIRIRNSDQKVLIKTMCFDYLQKKGGLKDDICRICKLFSGIDPGFQLFN